MRRLIHLTLAPRSRFIRLILGEKRLAYDAAAPEEGQNHLPIFIDLDGTRVDGLWAIVDYLEGTYDDRPLIPEAPAARAEALRLLDWAMEPLHDTVTTRIVFEKGAQRHTGATVKRTPDMAVIREGREALKLALAALGEAADRNGYLACRDCTLGDLAVAAHLSALDYFGEVPWTDYPAAAEWYLRIKSRPSFRTLLADRVPGQPPTASYAELDF